MFSADLEQLTPEQGVGWCRWANWIFSKNHSTQSIFGTPWRGSYRSKTTEINELESGDTPRVSGHPKPTTSDGDTASQSQ